MRHRFVSRLLMLVAIAVVAVIGSACGDSDEAPTTSATFAAGSTMAQIADRGKIVVGVKYDVPLFGLLDPVSNEVDGFDVAVAKEIAKALGLAEAQVEFVEAPTANRIPMLVEDKADLIISTFTITDERKAQVDFSRPYYKAGQSLLVKKDDTTIRRVADLNGRSVCAQTGSTSEGNVMDRAPQARLVPAQVISTCVSAMKDGSVDAVSTDDTQLAGFAYLDKDVKLVGGQFTTELYGVGIKKGKSDLVQFVDAEITKMLKDGRWEKIYTHYLGSIEGLPSPLQAMAVLPATS